jgi:hypothetical protein
VKGLERKAHAQREASSGCSRRSNGYPEIVKNGGFRISIESGAGQRNAAHAVDADIRQKEIQRGTRLLDLLKCI